MITKDKKKGLAQEQKNKGKTIEVKLNKITIVFLVLVIISYLCLNLVALIMPNQCFSFYIITLGRDTLGVIASSIIIGIWLNYVDVNFESQKKVNMAINEWDKSATSKINEIFNYIDNIYNDLNYITDSSKYPLDGRSNLELGQFIKRIEQQIHINNNESDEFYDNCFMKVVDYYLNKYNRLNMGHLYYSYNKELILIPDSNKKSISVKTIIKLSQKVPQTKTPTYLYKPKFNSKKEADSMSLIKYSINGNEKCTINNPGSTNEGEAYFVEYNIPVISNCLNEIEIESEYVYSLNNKFSFFEAYFIPDPIYQFSIKCSVIGTESENWDINISNYGYKNNDDKVVKSKSASNENSITASSNEWVSEGTTCIIVNRKETNV